MIIEDSKSDPQAAVEAFKRIESTRPPLFYTSFLSNVGVALAPLADENKVVLVGLVTSALAFTRGHEMVYRYWPLAQADIGPALRILQDLKVKKLGILYSNEEYGTEEQKLLANAFEGTGGSVIRQSFELDTKDFSGQIKSLMGQDAIYTATLGSNLTTSIVQLKGAGYRGQVVMPSSGASPAFFAMPEMQGVYLIAPVIYNPRYLFAREASDRFTARYQKPFNHWSAAGYDFIKLTAGLLEDQPVSRKSLQDLLAAGFEYSGVFGHIVVRPGGHEMSFPLSAAQIVDNALKFR